ncbi:MAG: hypothetical protein QCH31_07500 [Methanolobus sp.]|nr:hypothetical protein [Methanolobus sp.]
MKFIEKLFGKRKRREVPQESVLEFSELEDIAKAEAEKQENILRPFVKDIYEDIKGILKELEATRNEFLRAEPIEGASKRGEKLGDSNRDNVDSNLKLLHDKLKIPGSDSPTKASEFYAESRALMKTFSDNTTRSLMYIKAIYPQEHQKINQGLSGLEDALGELQSSVSEGNEKIETLGNIIEEIHSIESLQKEIERSIKKMDDMESKYESLKIKLSEDESGLSELEGSKEFERAKQLENDLHIIDNRMAEIESEARRLFTPLSKAISRMEKQDENEICVLSPENRKRLKAIQDEPLNAIGFELEPFFREIKTRVESGELGLKDQMSDKTLKHIQNVVDKDLIKTLNDQRQDCISERNVLLDELKSLSIHQKKKEIEREIKKHHSKIVSINHDIDSEKKHLNSLEEELEKKRSLLLSNIHYIFGDKVQIRYDNL